MITKITIFEIIDYLYQYLTTGNMSNIEGKVLWCYDYEVIGRDSSVDFGHMFSGTPPFYVHSGKISLNADSIEINGDVDLTIRLSELTQLYLGFDDVYLPTLVKNFGLFWQPLRLNFNYGNSIYLIIDYNFFSSGNKKWFTEIKNRFENE